MSNGLELLAIDYANCDYRKNRERELKKDLFGLYQNQTIQDSKLFKESGLFQQLEEDKARVSTLTRSRDRRALADILSNQLFGVEARLKLRTSFHFALNRNFRVFFKSLAEFGATVGLKLLGVSQTIDQITIEDQLALEKIEQHAEEFAERALYRYMDAYRRELRDTYYVSNVTLSEALNRILEGRKFSVTLGPLVNWATSQAYNLGVTLQYLRSGVPRHRWISVSHVMGRDSRHVDEHGQVVSVGSLFFSTFEAFPSQKEPGCRCLTLPEMDNETLSILWLGEETGSPLGRMFL